MASNGTEEYFGQWVNDKMSPKDDKFEDCNRIKLIESTKALINCSEEVSSTGKTSNMIEKLWNNTQTDSTVGDIHSVDHGSQNELFQKLVSNSLELSIHLLEDNVSDWHKSKSHPPQWPETSRILKRGIAKASFQDENEVDCDDTEKSIASEDDEVERMSETISPQPSFITYPNGDTYLGSIDSEKQTKEDYGGNLSLNKLSH